MALGQHTNPALQELYKGLDGAAFHEHFEVTKIPTDTRDEAYVVEQTLIDQLKETGLLLNVALDARSPGKGVGISEEGKRKLSLAAAGRKISEEHKARLSEVHRGKEISPEHRAALSDAHKGVPKAPEHVAKVAQAHFKKVVCDGVEYASVKEFAEKNGLSMMTASRRAKALREKERHEEN